MAASKNNAGETEGATLQLGRAPVDRLFVGCVVGLTLLYGGWLLVLQLWPPDADAVERQAYAGFVSGFSQPPVGPGEESPAAAGELGSSKRGTRGYFAGATPRPVAEGARIVDAPEEVEAKSEPETEPETELGVQSRPELNLERVAAAQAEPGARPSEGASAGLGPAAGSRSTAGAARLGRLGLVERVIDWLAPKLG